MLKNLDDLFLGCSAGCRRLLLNDDGFRGELADLWRRCSCCLFSDCYGARAVRDGLLLNRYFLRLLLLLRGCVHEFLLNYFLNYLWLLLRCWLYNLLGDYLWLHLLRRLLLYNNLLLLGLWRLRLNYNLLCRLSRGLLGWLLDDLECLPATWLYNLLYLRMRLLLNYLRWLLTGFNNLLR